MDMQRTILWMIFALSLLFLWDGWQKHNGNPSLFGGLRTTSVESKDSPSERPVDVPTAAPQASDGSAIPSAQETAVQAAQQSEHVVITTDLLRLTFDTLGAQIIKAELLEHPDSEDRSQPTVLLDDSATRTYLAQTGVVGAAAGSSFPTHRTPFALTSSERTLTGDSLQVTFEAESGGLKLTKVFTFYPNSYVIHVNHNLVNVSDAVLSPALYYQLTRDGNPPPGENTFYSTFTGPAIYTDAQKFQKISFSNIEKGRASYEKQANDGWLGMVQHYFAVAWVPPQGVTRNYEMLKVGNNLYAARAIQSASTLEPGTGNTVEAQLWIGPQDQNSMAEVAEGLDLVVDYGWLTIIAKPLFMLMTWLHQWLQNWGWSIVALTVLIKLVFFPLSAAGYRSMAKMKKVTPRMTAIREKYGDDRQKMNVAMMELYRNEKINPLGGCLPMVVQIPVFIALYWVLLASVEMRNAPWILWVQDLSSTDPFFILPALMMATMFLQIKLNPTPPDPMQAKVMMIMPLVFGGMMFFFPAGLVLYWVVNNILSIAQQWFVTRKATAA